jgi:hypothetical protein
MYMGQFFIPLCIVKGVYIYLKIENDINLLQYITQNMSSTSSFSDIDPSSSSSEAPGCRRLFTDKTWTDAMVDDDWYNIEEPSTNTSKQIYYTIHRRISRRPSLHPYPKRSLPTGSPLTCVQTPTPIMTN